MAGPSEPQLLRLPYHSKATGKAREFFVYLPTGYEVDETYRWPVILHLHGGGEQGDGKEDLDWVLFHGPLAEAWLRHRDLPFVMIGPQLPVFDNDWQLELRAGVPRPVRRPYPAPCWASERPGQPMALAPDVSPVKYDCTEAWGDEGFPGGWQLCEEDVTAILDTVLSTYRTDSERVYMTGESYGGHGTWHMAMTYPERFAAIAPVCGDGNSSLASVLAERQLPIWMFHGGRDTLNKRRSGHMTWRMRLSRQDTNRCGSRFMKIVGTIAGLGCTAVRTSMIGFCSTGASNPPALLWS